MTTATISEADLDVLADLLDELGRAGRIEEGRAVARAYAALTEILYPEPGLPEDDPELAAMLDEAERDFEAGIFIPHEEVVRRLQALDDA
ncbi:MAG: hypothetical protein ACRDJE_06515 [Dehalococcoidia bacterium]